MSNRLLPPSALDARARRVSAAPGTDRAGIAFVAVAGALWGSVGIAAKVLFRFGVSPLDAAIWRAGGAFLILLAAALLSRGRPLRVHARDLPLLGAYGLVGVALFMTVYFHAINLSTVATAAMLLYTAPAWVALFARVIFGEPLTAYRGGAVILTFIGSSLVVRAYDPEALRLSLTGVLAGLGAGLTYALYSILAKGVLRRYGPFTTLLYGLGIGSLFLVLFARRVVAPPLGALPAVAYLAIVTTLVAHVLFINGLRRIEVGRASIVATVEPLVAALLGVVILGERMEGLQWVGAVLVLSGVVLVQK